MPEPDFGVAVGSRLKTRLLGRPLHFFETIDSTNTYATQLAVEGAAEGTLVVADAQTGGRGRLGRSWVSPAGGEPVLLAHFAPAYRRQPGSPDQSGGGGGSGRHHCRAGRAASGHQMAQRCVAGW